MPPHVRAERDQTLAQAREGLDKMVAYARGMLATGLPVDDAASVLATAFMTDLARAGSLATVAVLRLAQQPESDAS
jgi:hypothetical protein